MGAESRSEQGNSGSTSFLDILREGARRTQERHGPNAESLQTLLPISRYTYNFWRRTNLIQPVLRRMQTQDLNHFNEMVLQHEVLRRSLEGQPRWRQSITRTFTIGAWAAKDMAQEVRTLSELALRVPLPVYTLMATMVVDLPIALYRYTRCTLEVAQERKQAKLAAE